MVGGKFLILTTHIACVALYICCCALFFPSGFKVFCQHWMATSVEALGDLFSKHADVDRQVHLRVVVATINELHLDSAAALRVSQLIEQQSCFSAEEKKELQKTVEERLQSITKEPGKIRRAQQNYSQLYLWLTEPTWEAIMSGIFTKQTEALFLHLHLLGLQLPSEDTFATMTGIIAIFQPGGQDRTAPIHRSCNPCC